MRDVQDNEISDDETLRRKLEFMHTDEFFKEMIDFINEYTASSDDSDLEKFGSDDLTNEDYKRMIIEGKALR